MTRLNLGLLLLLVLCALATVTASHQGRKLFNQLDRAQAEQKRIEVEWGQLRLEQSTWAKHALVEGIARRQLSMRAPDQRHLQFVAPAPAAPAAAAGSAIGR